MHWRLVSLLHYRHDKRPKHIAAAHASTSTSNKKLHRTHQAGSSARHCKVGASGSMLATDQLGLTKTRVYQWPCETGLLNSISQECWSSAPSNVIAVRRWLRVIFAFNRFANRLKAVRTLFSEVGSERFANVRWFVQTLVLLQFTEKTTTYNLIHRLLHSVKNS